MTSAVLQNIKKDINKNEEISDKIISITRFQYFKKSNILKVKLRVCDNLNNEEEEWVKKAILNNLKLDIKVEILSIRQIEGATLSDIISEHWLDVVGGIMHESPLSRDVLLSDNKHVDNSTIIIKHGSEPLINYIKKKNIEEKISNIIMDLYGLKSRIQIQFDPSLQDNNYEEKKREENKKILDGVLEGKIVQGIKEEKKPEKPKEIEKPKRDFSRFKKEPKTENCIIGRSISTETTSISEINMTSGIVSVLGDVFKTDIMETRTGRVILTFFITDYTGSIIVKCFLKGAEAEEVLEKVKKGLYCKVRGEATYDQYARELVIMAKDIVKMEKKERMDGALEKRVELHAHTTMSTMDAVVSADKLISTAAKWGHKAIAITDHGVVQAFPEAQSSGKKNDIKIIYGVEGYLVNDGEPIVLNDNGESFNDTYVVFDLETTGFSPINDEIIEIGATKLKNGEVVDKFSTFVNPGMKIPYKITELTGITDEMVKDARDIDEILPEFLEFCKDSVIVAHNAGFDTSFIKYECRRLRYEFNLPIMDTVVLARFLFPELKKVKLNLVAKHLNISLENHHRAVDDAGATAEILLKCFEIIKERYEIHDLKSLNEVFLKDIDIRKLNTYHVIVLSKTQAGLKNLYKLISEAHIDNFFRRPRTKRSRLQELRDGLIIGSACEAGEVFKAVIDGRSDDEIKEIMKFYDYIEIQPIGNNQFLVEKGIAKDDNELRELNNKIYRLAKEINKPCVATGDVHFLNPQDEAFRRIIMAGKGFKDADNQPPLYFKTTEEMIREFSYLGEREAIEVVVTNPSNIADSVENIKPIPDETYPPKIPGAEEQIRDMTMNKVHSIYGDPLPEVVQKRLDKELNSIINNGYAVLYLIAQKLVAKSLQDGYLVGSRGSVGSSFVATMSDITEVNGLPPHYVCPKCKYSEFFLDGSISSGADLEDKDCPKCGAHFIKDGHDIPFETFLGFEGDKEPDIDLNFSGEYQGVVHKYTEELFGEGYTFKAGTIGTVAEKTAYGYVRKYLDERGKIVSSAEIERLTIGCTGIKRTSGQHPGGIMVVPSDNEIYNFTPIQHPADDPESDIVTTHFDYHSISGRLLKLDILGHDDPTVLRMLQDLTGVDPKTIPLNDKKVLSLFTSPEALGLTREELGCEVGSYGLPEFGTKFVRGMLVDTQPQTFADLVRISGLSHGTDVWLNNAQEFIKNGDTTLRECIATRDDIMVYLMYKNVPPKTAFTIMEMVRKGKGLKPEFEEIMRDNNVPEWYIESCKRIKYMFPKGHAVAYVMMAVRIAYFKVYYPEAYYCTYFTVRADDFDADLIAKGESAVYEKLNELYELGNKVTAKDKGMITTLELSYEMYKRGIKLLKVDLYKSEANKFIIEDGALRPPISALQGVGVNAAKSIVEARKDGEFISKEDLRLRSKVSKTVIETMANHGCLDGMSDTNQLSLF